MSWRFVLDSTQSLDIWQIDYYVRQIVRPSGYKFFTWNGWVYQDDGKKYSQTEVTVEDLF